MIPFNLSNWSLLPNKTVGQLTALPESLQGDQSHEFAGPKVSVLKVHCHQAISQIDYRILKIHRGEKSLCQLSELVEIHPIRTLVRLRVLIDRHLNIGHQLGHCRC